MAKQYTQYAGVRPFGVALILAGVDKTGSSLFLTDPSGTYIGYNAIAIGAGSDQVNEFLEKNYRADTDIKEAAVLAIESIYLVSEDKTGIRHIKMAMIDYRTKSMRKIEEQEIEKYSVSSKENASKRTDSSEQ
jgi:proteasome alpha subunit